MEEQTSTPMMGFEEWEEKYKPIMDTDNDIPVDFLGNADREEQLQQALAENRVWTLGFEGEVAWLSSKAHWVNRDEYWVTRVSHNGEDINVDYWPEAEQREEILGQINSLVKFDDQEKLVNRLKTMDLHDAYSYKNRLEELISKEEWNSKTTRELITVQIQEMSYDELFNYVDSI